MWLVGKMRALTSTTFLLALIVSLQLQGTRNAAAAGFLSENILINKNFDNHDFFDEDEGEENFSPEQLEQIKERILSGLGLSSIPTRTKGNVSREEYEEAYEEFLRSVDHEGAWPFLRQAPLQEGSQDEEDEVGEEGQDSSEYRFYSSGVPLRRKGRRKRSLQLTASRKDVAFFYLAKPFQEMLDKNGASVVGAVGRFWKTGSPFKSGDENRHKIAVVSFYKLDNASVNQQAEESNLIQRLNISTSSDEWLEIDMTDVVNEWLQSPQNDPGVLIQCLQCEDYGVTVRASGLTKVPTLDIQTAETLKRVKRSKKKSKRSKRHHRAVCSNGKLNTRCCMRSMIVRIADLPNFEFVVAPAEFEANYCSGKCPARFKPANEHALLQSILNMRNKREVPGLCCAPTQLRGLPILHFNEHDKLVTTIWKDVIVERCGCT